MKVVAGKHELDAIVINGRDNYYDDRNRDTLEINFADGKYSIDSLKDIFSNEENTATISLINDETKEAYNYYDYVKLMAINYENYMLSPETSEEPAKYEKRIIVKMCQLTLSEKQYKKVQSQLDDILVAMATGAVGGEE